MPKVTIWIAYSNEGDAFVSHTDADEASTGFAENHTVPDDTGMRVIPIDLELPEIRGAVLVQIPEVDGPVTVTLA